MSIEQSAKDEVAAILADIKSLKERLISLVTRHPATDQAALKLDMAAEHLEAHPAITGVEDQPATEASQEASTDAQSKPTA